MTQEQNQPTLEQRLLQIGRLQDITRGINKSKKTSERYSLYRDLAEEVSDGNPQLYKQIYGDIRNSPEEAFRYAVMNVGSKSREAEPIYKEGKKELLEKIVSTIKSDVKKTKNKTQAAEVLSQYLEGLFEVPELDQTGADEYAQQDAAQALGVDMNFSARGNVEQYRNKHESLIARISASQYLKDVKDEKTKKVTGYELDESKLKKTMDNIVQAAVVYKNMMEIAEVKKKEAQRNAS